MHCTWANCTNRIKNPNKISSTMVVLHRLRMFMLALFFLKCPKENSQGTNCHTTSNTSLLINAGDDLESELKAFAKLQQFNKSTKGQHALSFYPSLSSDSSNWEWWEKFGKTLISCLKMQNSSEREAGHQLVLNCLPKSSTIMHHVTSPSTEISWPINSSKLPSQELLATEKIRRFKSKFLWKANKV